MLKIEVLYCDNLDHRNSRSIRYVLFYSTYTNVFSLFNSILDTKVRSSMILLWLLISIFFDKFDKRFVRNLTEALEYTLYNSIEN